MLRKPASVKEGNFITFQGRQKTHLIALLIKSHELGRAFFVPTPPLRPKRTCQVAQSLLEATNRNLRTLFLKNKDPFAKPEEISPFSSTMDEYWKHGEIDIEEDARKERQVLNDTAMKDPAPPVDPAFENMTENG